MLHGKGASQSFLTNDFLNNRRKGLEDINKLSVEDQIKYDISAPDGGGRTKDSTYEIEQFPFPVDQSIRKKKIIDIRKVDPRIGEMSD